VNGRKEHGGSEAGRGSWPVRVVALGAERGDDLSATTTAEERLAMMWRLAQEGWSLSGAPLPPYARGETPVTRRPWPPTKPGS
jgi:hypothetical protein